MDGGEAAPTPAHLLLLLPYSRCLMMGSGSSHVTRTIMFLPSYPRSSNDVTLLPRYA